MREKERKEEKKNKDRSCSFYSCLRYVIIPRACFINGFYLWYCELYNQPPRYDDLLRIINSSHTYAKPVPDQSGPWAPHPFAREKDQGAGSRARGHAPVFAISRVMSGKTACSLSQRRYNVHADNQQWFHN